LINWALWTAIRRTREEVKALVGRRYPVVKVVSYGATRVDPRHLVILTVTDKDENRARLMGDFALLEDLRAALQRAGYPAAAVPLVRFCFESKETLDRDFQGSWYRATK
jgi:hypothetical protein